MKRGLILEGGAMRGLFTAGVMDVLMEAGMPFDGAIGVSAGACFGCNYKSGQIGRVLRYNCRFCADPRYSGLDILRKTGNIYSTDFCYREVPLVHDPFDFAAYEANPMDFYVVATDVLTGRPVYHKYTGWDDHGFDWIRASASMPLVSQMVEIEGRQYLDGGISDSVPLSFFESIGYDRNLLVLTQPMSYRKKPNPLLPLLRRKYKRYPLLVKAIQDRHMMYNRTLDSIAHREARGEIFVIRPAEKLPVGKVEKDPEKLRLAYEMGRREAEKSLPQLRAFLQLP